MDRKPSLVHGILLLAGTAAASGSVSATDWLRDAGWVGVAGSATVLFLRWALKYAAEKASLRVEVINSMPERFAEFEKRATDRFDDFDNKLGSLGDRIDAGFRLEAEMIKNLDERSRENHARTEDLRERVRALEQRQATLEQHSRWNGRGGEDMLSVE